MKTLTEIANAIIEQMGAEEQTTYLAAMAQGKRPTKPPMPMTDGEKWWREKLHPDGEWATTWTPDALLDDFIKGTGWTKTRQGAATSMGTMLKKLCPAIRRHNRKYLMPTAAQARKAFRDVFPSSRGTGMQASGEMIDGAKVLKVTMGERI